MQPVQPAKNMTPDAHLKIVHNTRSCKNLKEYAIGCEYIQIMINDPQLTIGHKAGIHRGLRDQYIAACNRNHPWLTKAIVRSVRQAELDYVVSSGILSD